jgi:PAS domain S-box-containing protein
MDTVCVFNQHDSMKTKPSYQELEERIRELEAIRKENQVAEDALEAKNRMNKNLNYYIQVNDLEEASRISYQTLFSEAIIPIFLIDPAENTIIDVNRATEQLTGSQRDELVGAHISKIIHENKDAANKLMKHVEQKTNLRQFNTVILTKDLKEKIIDPNYSYYIYRGKKLI